jgi:DNA helicase TIP49 (TBP-interacting protein)
VAEAVVDGLEPVEVEEQNGRLERRARVAVQGVLDTVDEQRPVRQVGEAVVERLVRERFLDRLAVGDVVQVDDDTAHVGVVGEVYDAGACYRHSRAGARGRRQRRVGYSPG